MTSSKTLMVAPYAPYRDGIAVYAIQEVRQMRAAGENVEVLSPLPSAAHHHLGLGGPKGFARLLKQVEQYDRVIIQLYPELVLGACHNFVERAASWAALAAVCKRRPTELRVHEIDYTGVLKHAIEHKAATAAMTAAAEVSVHTPPEAEKLKEAFGVEANMVDHGSHFRKRARLSKAEARAELELEGNEHIFLAIGFLQDHKGFDRAIKAFAASQVSNASLHVVGSVRVEVPELLDYAARLELLADSVPNAYLHRRYVGDDEFDRWIVAADTVVLPYREIWSSGVLERAKVYDRPVIAARVGGLANQIAAGSELFSNDVELASAIKRRASTNTSDINGAHTNTLSHNEGDEVNDSTATTRTEIEAEVRRSLGIKPTVSTAKATFHRAPALSMPAAGSHRPGIGQMKRAVQAATAWQIRPLVERINALEAAVAEAFERLEREDN